MTDPMKRFPDLVDQLLYEDMDPFVAPRSTINHSHTTVCGCDGLSDCSHDHDAITSPSHSVAVSQRSATAPSAPYLATATTDTSLPAKICTFHANGLRGIGQGCLRVNCTYFHGTEEQLMQLRLRVVAKSQLGDSTSKLSVDDNNDLPMGNVSQQPAVNRVKRTLVDTDLGDKLAIVCLAHLSNSCRRPGCRFLHLLPNIRPLPIALCERNQRGVCNLGPKCRFFHGRQEDLSRMHAEGVTLYDPFTGEPHDPTTSIDELMKIQKKTTVKAAAPPPAPAYSEPHAANPFVQSHYYSQNVSLQQQPLQQAPQQPIFVVVPPFMFGPGGSLQQHGYPTPLSHGQFGAFNPMPMYPQMMCPPPPPPQPQQAVLAHQQMYPHRFVPYPTRGGNSSLRPQIDEANSSSQQGRYAPSNPKYTVERQGFS